ncbi:MAG: hypothetical protein AB7G12_12580 [Thermoanaerobaculia bacterium]
MIDRPGCEPNPLVTGALTPAGDDLQSEWRDALRTVCGLWAFVETAERVWRFVLLPILESCSRSF